MIIHGARRTDVGASRPRSHGTIDQRVLAELLGDYPIDQIVGDIYDQRMRTLHSHFHFGTNPEITKPEKVLGYLWAEEAERKPDPKQPKFLLFTPRASSWQLVHFDLEKHTTSLICRVPGLKQYLVIDKESTLIRNELVED